MSAPPSGSGAAAAPPIEEARSFLPRFDASGLVPCIAVDARSGNVLMLAWANAEAVRLTLDTGFAHYWSRSRGALWKKGETSGALQRVVEVLTDCDQDTLLLRVETAEPDKTCHTGRPTCFYRRVPLGPGTLDRPLEPANNAQAVAI